jgi:hypothetical protein
MKRGVLALLVLSLAAGCGGSSGSKQTHPPVGMTVLYLGTLPVTPIEKARLAQLVQQALSRRRKSVPAGGTRVFPPHALTSFDLVTCRIRGHHFELHVPNRLGDVTSLGWGGLDFTVIRNHDGSVTATCRGSTP